MRKLANWLESFEEYCAPLSAPKIFTRWAGMSLLAAALERKTFMRTSVGTLYPNLYLFFIAPPGVGKTIHTSKNWHTFKKLPQHYVASSSITRATVISELADATRHKQTADGMLSFNALYICANELGVLLPAYESEFMNKLTDIYDGHPYSESRRNEKHNVSIKAPVINLLAAGTPGFLAGVIPELAWEQGFMSRVLIVYSNEVIRQSLWSDANTNKALWDDLMHDYRLISNMTGEYRFDAEAMRKTDEFYMGGAKETEPLHPKLQHYCTRRPVHLFKLMMNLSVATNDELVIDGDIFDTALRMLLELEERMPETFVAMNSGGDTQVIRETWYYLYTTTAKTGEPVQESQVITWLSQRIPADKIRWIISIMTEGGLIKLEVTKGGKAYRAQGQPPAQR